MVMIGRRAFRHGERTVVRRKVFILMRRVALVVIAALLTSMNPGTAAAGTAPAPADVFIYRATPGGIAAAIAAARHGRRVVLCEYHSHVGGMTTSGLGKSDIESRAMIGGLFKEFVAGVKQHYISTYGTDHPAVATCHDGYYAEPAVAERVLNAMLAAEPGIEVVRRHRLESAEVDADCVTAVEIIDRESGARRRIEAGVFIDASYEGDLLAAAGARYRLGRESRDEFNEPHAGVVYYDYQEKRLLPGTTGAGDNRLPAFTYRLCLTTDPTNAVPLVEPPPGYDRSRYTGYFDDLAAGRMSGPKVLKPGRGYNPRHFDTLVRALSVAEIPHRKADVNINPRPLAFPFPEENVGYIEGDDAERQRICEHLRNLTLGLLWFLQNDPEVPEAHRQLARELNLPADEFTDNGHFPYQLYVREGRRLVGVATLTEYDITGHDEAVRRHPDAIAVGEFPIDSFPCRKRQPDDTVVLEGYLGMLDHITRPYEIPYGIMIPEKINGLIVPVAASTTHVAFSSIRMEPTWMALGQAAGTAAHLALERRVSLRNIPIGPLQQLLLATGQVLHHAGHATPHAAYNPDSPLMLAGDWVPKDSRTIDFQKLPKIESTHAVVSDVSKARGVNQHNYLVHHDGRYWAMWSDGPGVEDKVGQVVKFATSPDALTWSEPKLLTPYPPGSAPGSPHYGERTAEGFRWIARGFWLRDGDLLALASLDEAGGFFGKSLALHAFRWEGKERGWVDRGVILDDAINNFAPLKLPSGDWMMSRRRHDYRKRGVDFVVGGVTAVDAWKSFPVLGSSSELKAEEPDWWVLPDGNLCGLFRDNQKRGFLYRSFSTDSGCTWSRPIQTNFPDATSKFRGLRLADGRYVLVSNANPKKRDPLVISVSRDGLVFDQMGWLVGGRHVDYPHIIEHDGHLLVAFATQKMTVEVLRFPLEQLDRLQPVSISH